MAAYIGFFCGEFALILDRYFSITSALACQGACTEKAQ